MAKRYVFGFLCMVLGFSLAGSAFGGIKPAANSKHLRTFSQFDEVIPGVIVIKFGRTVSVSGALTRISAVNAVLAEQGVLQLERIFTTITPLSPQAETQGRVDLSRLYYGHLAEGVDPRTAASTIDALEEVEYAEPKFMNYLNDVPSTHSGIPANLLDTPNDPLLSNQTGYFTRMNAFNGWTIAKGDTSVIIAVVDGGTYWPHEDLQPNYRFGWNFANNTNDPSGLPGTPNSAAHGTATASHFGARTNNGIGMAGTSWNCSMIAVNAASPTSDNGIAYGYEGIVFAYTNGAHVINCSWGRTGGYSLFEQDVINAATQAGALVVVAAGNGTNNNSVGKSNDLSPDYPPNYANVLAVGASSNTSDARASFSNYGRTVPVFAPGVSIYSAFNGGGYGNGGSGTSYSSPLTAGLAGIIKAQHPTWTPRQIALQIKTTCDSIDASNPSQAGELGRGRINFARALSESHAGIDIISADIRTPSGRTLFLQNDTILLTLTVKNILFSTANNLVFTGTSSSGSVTVLQGTVNAGTLAPNQQATLPPIMYRVGVLSASTDAALRLNWVSNTNERDSWAYKITVFPATPQWESQASPSTANLYSVKAVTADIAWACGAGSAVLRTTNGGAIWTPATGNLASGDYYCMTAIDANRAWVGRGGSVAGDGKIYATTDGGETWVQQTYPGTQSPFINGIWMFANGVGYAQGDPASANRFVVLKTTDFGVTWAHVPAEPVGGSGEAGWNNSFWFTDQDHGWFGTNLTKIWRTTDGGTTWVSSATTGQTNSYGVSFKDNNNGIATFSTGAVRTTTNGGASWTTVSSPTTTSITGISHVAGSNYAWLVAGSSAFRSTNNGANWSAQTLYPFTGSLNHVSFVDTSTGWTVSSNGEILRYRVGTVTGVESVGSELPSSFELQQNYPNPFNPETVIRYSIGAGAMHESSFHVVLKIYDVLGREVARLVDELQTAGSKSVRWDASSIPSGVYFYRLTATSTSGNSNDFSATKKLLLTR
jgi:photosystem II stability/assembly factor-like uncharacterized protein